MKIRLFFAWYDLWVGAYWDSKKRVLYLCLVPCVVIALSKTERPAPAAPPVMSRLYPGEPAVFQSEAELEECTKPCPRCGR